MIQVNRIYLIFNRLVTKKFLVDTSEITFFITNNLVKHIFPSHVQQRTLISDKTSAA